MNKWKESAVSIYTGLKANRLLAFLVAVTFVLIGLITQEKSRVFLRQQLNPNSQRLLAKVTGEITGDGSQKVILKFQTPKGIKVEILDLSSPSTKLFEWTFTDTKDAFLDLPSGVSNLFLKDANGDNLFDVVVPLATGKIQPQIQVIYFNTDTQSFGLLQSI